MKNQKKPIKITQQLLIYNDIVIEKGIPADLGNWIVDKPNSKYIKSISDHFRSITNSSAMGPIQELKYIGKEKNRTTFQHGLKPEEYRYLVVKPKLKGETKFDKISEAFRLSSCDLWADSILSNINEQISIIFHPDQVSGYFGYHKPTRIPLNVNWKQIDEIVRLRENLNEEKFSHIKYAIKMFKDNDSIDDKSYLKHLGYFAIIESLLSHVPNPSDSYDSISRQLKRNLILLNNRVEGETNLLIEYFDKINADKVISKLYSYRSKIAHGANAEDELKSLCLLRKKGISEEWNSNPREWISWYLRLLVKGLLIHALREPQLVTDLK